MSTLTSGSDPPISPDHPFLTPDSFNKVLLPYRDFFSSFPLPSGPLFRSSHPFPSPPFSSFSPSDSLLSDSWFFSQKLAHNLFIPSPFVSSSYIPPTPSAISHTHSPNGKGKVYDHPIRTKKISLSINFHMKSYLNHAFDVTRAIYNECVFLCCKSPSPLPPNHNSLRKLLVTHNSSYWIDKCLHQYHYTMDQALAFKESFERVPADIRHEAIIEFTKAFEIQLKMVQTKKLRHFKMDFKRKKKMLQEVITLRKRDMRQNTNGSLSCYVRAWQGGVFNFYREKVALNDLPESIKIIKTKAGKYYMALSKEQPKREKKLKYNAVALDPGVRIFQTTYDTEGVSYLIGKDGCDKIDKLAGIAARMRAGMKRYYNKNGKRRFRKTEDKRERKGLNKAANRIEERIKNMISDAHRKIVKFLCEKYDTVIIPKFGSQGMVRKVKRKIGKTTARKLLRWSHYKFRELLRHKGEMTGTKIVVGREEYTSKTCGRCMYVNRELGGKREIKCKMCGIEMHRDINAARNIMMYNWKEAKLEIMKGPRRMRLEIRK